MDRNEHPVMGKLISTAGVDQLVSTEETADPPATGIPAPSAPSEPAVPVVPDPVPVAPPSKPVPPPPPEWYRPDKPSPSAPPPPPPNPVEPGDPGSVPDKPVPPPPETVIPSQSLVSAADMQKIIETKTSKVVTTSPGCGYVMTTRGIPIHFNFQVGEFGG